MTRTFICNILEMRLLPVRCGIAESLQEEKAVVDDDILLTSRQVWCRAFKNKSGNVFFIL